MIFDDNLRWSIRGLRIWTWCCFSSIPAQYAAFVYLVNLVWLNLVLSTGSTPFMTT